LALFSISEYGVDLIISDWNMPNVSGLELFKKVRKEEAFKNTAFILLTVEGDKDKVLEAFKEGSPVICLTPCFWEICRKRSIVPLKMQVHFTGSLALVSDVH
jgi:PleD family two-component response regulator